jgi:hypothetical protein
MAVTISEAQAELIKYVFLRRLSQLHPRHVMKDIDW